MTGVRLLLRSGRSSRRLGQLSRALLPALFAGMLVACGDDPPAPRGQGATSYWTTDMSLVKIWFAYADPAIPADRKPDLVLPRAYIRLAIPYEWPNPKVLPDELHHVETVFVFMATDTGEALPVAADRKGSGESLRGYDRTRYVTMSLGVSFYPKEIYRWLRPPPRPGSWTPGMSIDDDGYVRAPSANGLYESSFCGKTRPPTLEGHCKYLALLTRKISVQAYFADYRAHGGLPYVENVLTLVKSQICKYNDCST